MNNYFKWFLIFGIMVTLFYLGYSVLDIPRNKQIDNQYSVIAYHYNEEALLGITSVRIKGDLTKRISGNSFSGTIEFYDATKEEMQEYTMWLVKVTNANYLSGWIEDTSDLSNSEPNYIGTISLTPHFKNITIWFNSDLSVFMAGPASTLEEAIKIDQMIRNIKTN